MFSRIVAFVGLNWLLCVLNAATAYGDRPLPNQGAAQDDPFRYLEVDPSRPLGPAGQAIVFPATLRVPGYPDVGGFAVKLYSKNLKQAKKEALAMRVLQRVLGQQYTGPNYIGLKVGWRIPIYPHEYAAGIVMEQVHGISLQDVFNRMGRVNPKRALRLGSEIAIAAHDMHINGMVHRDLKPGNIMMSVTRDPLLTLKSRTRIIDYATVSAIGDDDDDAPFCSGVFSAPGVYLHQAPAPQDDIYGVGAIMYTALTGQQPFGLTIDMPVADIGYLVTHHDPEWEILPPVVRPIIRRAMTRDRQRSYLTALEFAKDLRMAAAQIE